MSSSWLILYETVFFFFFFFFFTYTCNGRESIVLGQIFKMEILMDLYVIRAPESENHILTFGLCVRVSVCISACVSVFSYQHYSKKFTSEISNLVFFISIMYRCYLKLFIKIRQKLCLQRHIKEFLCIKSYGKNFLLLNFCIFKLY